MGALDPDVVRVWLVPAAASADGAWVLSDRERATAARMVPGVRATYEAAHGALRMLLGEVLDADPRTVEVTAVAGQKPRLAGATEPRFSLSHSGDLAAVALGCGREVGVDVERLRPLAEEAGIARRVLTADEHARYSALDTADRTAWLLRTWARKEALIKATGEGLRADLTATSADGDAAWAVRELAIPGYAGAIAAAGHGWDLVVMPFPGPAPAARGRRVPGR